MSAFYRIEKERRLVLSFGAGVLTKEDILGHMDRLSKDPDFDPAFSQVADFTHITEIHLEPGDVRLLAKRNVFSFSSRRALVVKNDLPYGLARMFEIHRELNGEKGIRVCRSLVEALEWVFPEDAVS
jgi:hypothetical protein